MAEKSSLLPTSKQPLYMNSKVFSWQTQDNQTTYAKIQASKMHRSFKETSGCCQPLKAWTQKPAQYFLCHILLVKYVLKSPKFKIKEERPHISMRVAIFNLSRLTKKDYKSARLLNRKLSYLLFFCHMHMKC